MDDGFNPRGGWIEVITGGMFSGKSEELIRRIRRAEIARQRAQIFKPVIDDRLIAAGLDQDYLRRPFGPMPALLAVAEYVSKMHAVCVRCGGPAHYTQRVAGGNSQIEIGDNTYEARCRVCYERYQAEEASDDSIEAHHDAATLR